MNQFIFHPGSTGHVRDALRAAAARVLRALRASKRIASELAVVAFLLIAALALKLAMVAVSNTAVAEALASGLVFF